MYMKYDNTLTNNTIIISRIANVHLQVYQGPAYRRDLEIYD